jgi:hypothetical protein
VEGNIDALVEALRILCPARPFGPKDLVGCDDSQKGGQAVARARWTVEVVMPEGADLETFTVGSWNDADNPKGAADICLKNRRVLVVDTDEQGQTRFNFIPIYNVEMLRVRQLTDFEEEPTYPWAG